MTKRVFLMVVSVVMLLVVALAVNAQDISPIQAPADDANIAISFPPPVWTISETVDIVGTADLPGMTSYLVEYREIDFEAIANGQESLWFPATLPRAEIVRNGVVGTWNTTTVRDGLYEIRLTVNLSDGSRQTFVVSPLRVENDPNDGLALPVVESIVQATATLAPSGNRPTLAPSPTNIGGSGDPTVTALVDANVRSGDSVRYERIDALFEGNQAAVIGISTVNSWYYIELSDGRRGFIAPSTVDFTGNPATLPFIEPPPPPATATPTPTATPVTTANLQVTGLELDPASPNCGEPFDVIINVNNSGTGPTSSSATLSVVDTNNRTGTVAGSTVGGFPVIPSGGNFVVTTTLTINTFFNETHTITVRLDDAGVVPETNEGDNTRTIQYTLNQAGCG